MTTKEAAERLAALPPAQLARVADFLVGDLRSAARRGETLAAALPDALESTIKFLEET